MEDENAGWCELMAKAEDAGGFSCVLMQAWEEEEELQPCQRWKRLRGHR